VGDVTAAERHFAESLALAEACRSSHDRALTLLAHAELLAQRGERDRVRAMLTEIRSICAPLDARLALDQAERIAADLTERAGPASSPTPAPPGSPRRATRPGDAVRRASSSPVGLSVRESEVLRLVAQGLSNAEIAIHLSLSPRTVKVHVANILAKLGVANRAAATRFALDHNLA
jgi:DNA-binding NarL/FixJ family response regulator